MFNGKIPELQVYSVCFYIKILRARNSYDTLISYAVPENFNELYVGKYVF